MIRNITILLLLSLSYSATLLVPDEYSTIQSGINAAFDGDTVLVSDGTYYENTLSIVGKYINVRIKIFTKSQYSFTMIYLTTDFLVGEL